MMKKTHPIHAGCRLITLLMALTGLAGAETPLSAPDGQPADMTKPVKVFLLMGQSNMLGFGQVQGDKDGTLEHAAKSKGLYPFLIDDQGAWTTRQDVRNVFVMNSKDMLNSWLSAASANRGKIGPDLGIGWHMGELFDEPVLILKACIGNRCLGWDLLPPGSEPFEFEEDNKTMVHGGYGDFGIYEKGEEPPTSGWYAGTQYDADIASIRLVLENLDRYYPGAVDYEVAGIFWWQGDKDRSRSYWAERYETNLVQLIRALREEFDAPEAKFVCATLGQTERGAGGNEGKILDAMFAISDAEKYPEFEGEVATVYTHPFSRGGSSNGHYGGNAETYMDVGLAMGEAMAELFKGE